MNGEAYCRYIKPDGSRCQARPLTTAAHCFFHAPTASRDRRQAQQRGGRNRRAVLPLDTPMPSLATPRDVAAFLGETVDQVRKGQLDHKVGHALVACCSVLLKALNMSELERLAAEIDQMQEALEKQRESQTQLAVQQEGVAGDGGSCLRLEDFEVGPGECDGEEPWGRNQEIPFSNAGDICRVPPSPASSADDLWS